MNTFASFYTRTSVGHDLTIKFSNSQTDEKKKMHGLVLQNVIFMPIYICHSIHTFYFGMNYEL